MKIEVKIHEMGKPTISRTTDKYKRLKALKDQAKTALKDVQMNTDLLKGRKIIEKPLIKVEIRFVVKTGVSKGRSESFSVYLTSQELVAKMIEDII